MTYIEILIDTSGSMGAMKGTEYENKYLLPDGTTRMVFIKKMLHEQLLPTIDYADKIVVRTFKSSTDKAQTPIIEKIYEDKYDISVISQKVSSLPDDPLGGTPITAAITDAVNSLNQHPNADRKIILITDGEENGGGNYKETIDIAFATHGIFCKIFIVGICQEKEAEEKANYLSNKTKGVYRNLKPQAISDTNYSSVELAPLKKAILQDSIKNIQAAVSTVITPPQVQQPILQTQPKVQPQPIVQPQPKIQAEPIIQTLKDKIVTVKEESKRANSTIQLEQLENKIKEQVANSEKLLSEISSLKELIRLDVLLDSGIDATTLTIDNDYSESIRKRSETFLYKHLCEKHGGSNVKWLNETTESFSPHDFELFDEQGKTIKVIECKGTSKDKPTFYLTANEWTHFLTNKEIYQVYRVFNVEGEMNAVCIDNLLASILDGQVVPYLLKVEILKEGRVFLTLTT